MISFMEEALRELNKNYKLFKSIEYDQNDTDRDSDQVIKYSKTTNQYYCNIDGIELRGNIGKIFNTRILRNTEIKAHQVVRCCYGNECKKVLQQQYCKFYHDPSDLLYLLESGIISLDYYNATKKLTRNFASTSWLYAQEPTEYMRSFGSVSTLNHDLNMLDIRNSRERELDTFKSQVMHDILVLKYILNR